MKIVGVGAAFCIGCCPNIRNGTAIAAPAVWVSPPMAHDVRATSCKQPIDVVFQRRIAFLLTTRMTWSPASKRFLVLFKHYFNRERIENQISNSKIFDIFDIFEFLIYNNTYRMKSHTQQSQFATWKDQISSQKNYNWVGGPGPPRPPGYALVIQ